jgi:hypothetical protein
VVPGGHGVWVDQPARCGTLLAAFLDEQDAAQRSPDRRRWSE